MTKGGVMIGSTVRTRRARLKRKIRARGDQREGEAERRRADADERRQEQGVPGDAAAQVRGEAVEAPDRGIEELGQERAGREGAGIVPDGAREDGRDGKEHEDGDQRDDEADRRDHEGVAAAPAARREPVAEQHQEGDTKVRAAPKPMPAWRGPGDPRRAASQAAFQPLRPIAKPCSATSASPAVPAAASQRAGALAIRRAEQRPRRGEEREQRSAAATTPAR